MAWIESHQSLRDHKKTARVQLALHRPLPTIIGHLHLMWWWCLDNVSSDGCLDGVTPGMLAKAASWSGDVQQFFSALLEAGFIDQTDSGFCLHDWYDYAGKLLGKRELTREQRQAGGLARMSKLTASARQELARKAVETRWNRHKDTSTHTSTPSMSIPATVPTVPTNSITPYSPPGVLTEKKEQVEVETTLKCSNARQEDRQRVQREPTFDLPDWIKPETWRAFREIRQKKRAPLTPFAEKLLLAKLRRFRESGDDPNLVLEQSIESGWSSIYSVKGGNHDPRKNGNGQRNLRGLPASYTDPADL